MPYAVFLGGEASTTLTPALSCQREREQKAGLDISITSVVMTEGYAGLQSQALGLTDAAGLAPRLQVLTPRIPWRWLPAAIWPAPLRAMGLAPPGEALVVGCGGKAAAVLATLRTPQRRVVQVQHPRMDPSRFDLVVVNRHDRLTGPNVLVTRTALHRVTPARLAQARTEWAERLAHLSRPWVAVLVGGTNGRFRLDAAAGAALATQLGQMMQRDRVGIALTPSRRTDPAVRRVLADTLTPLGGWVWDMTGDNPYYGLLALADAIVVTTDSVSMVSEAVATPAPVLVAALPGRSRRIQRFTEGLRADGRIRSFAGRLEVWDCAPLDDTQAAADEMRRRLGF